MSLSKRYAIKENRERGWMYRDEESRQGIWFLLFAYFKIEINQ